MKKDANSFRIFCAAPEFAAAFEEIRSTLRERRGEVLRDAMDHPTRKRLVLKTRIAGVPVVLSEKIFTAQHALRNLGRRLRGKEQTCD